MTTRKSALARALAVAAGLVGVGAAGTQLGRADGATLRLRAREHLGHPRRPPARGERATLVAELFDAGNGRRVGELYGAAFALRGPGEPSGPDRLELHTFQLEDGTIVGSGTAGLGEGAFAVLGGTGRYAGARGTYVVRRSGDGEPADLEVSLIA